MRVVFGLMALCATADAAIVDEFRCQMRYTPASEARAIETTAEFAVTRKPVLFNSTDEVLLTEGTASLSTSGQAERYQGAFRLVYLHAVQKSRQTGQVLRAAQHVCLSHTFLVGARNSVSVDCRPRCQDAFDPKCKWKPVAVRNGVPVFDGRLLKPAAQALLHGNSNQSWSLSCRHETTIE